MDRSLVSWVWILCGDAVNISLRCHTVRLIHGTWCWNIWYEIAVKYNQLFHKVRYNYCSSGGVGSRLALLHFYTATYCNIRETMASTVGVSYRLAGMLSATPPCHPTLPENLKTWKPENLVWKQIYLVFGFVRSSRSRSCPTFSHNLRTLLKIWPAPMSHQSLRITHIVSMAQDSGRCKTRQSKDMSCNTTQALTMCCSAAGSQARPLGANKRSREPNRTLGDTNQGIWEPTKPHKPHKLCYPDICNIFLI